MGRTRGRGFLKRTAHAAGAVVVLAAALGAGQPASEANLRFPVVSRPSDHRELAFSARERVAEVFVKPGDLLKPGDPVMRLDDTVQRLTVELARLQAEDTSPVRAAQSALEFREAELRLTEEASSQAGANPRDVRLARYERDQAKLKLEQAELETAAGRITLQQHEARLAQMTLLSPIACAVLEVHKRPGEVVDEQTTVVTVVTTDPLWLDVTPPTQVALGIEVGQRARVTWEDVEGLPDLEGAVIFRSPAGHGGARQVLVRVEVPNPQGLPSGIHGTVRFLPRERAAAPTGRAGGDD